MRYCGPVECDGHGAPEESRMNDLATGSRAHIIAALETGDAGGSCPGAHLQSRQAEYVLATLDSRPAAQLRARAHFAAGELRAAEALARILLLQDPRDLRSLALLAEIASTEGQPGRAGEWLRRALAINPYDPEARSIAERIRRR